MNNSELLGHDQILQWFNHNALNGVATYKTFSYLNSFCVLIQKKFKFYCRLVKF